MNKKVELTIYMINWLEEMQEAVIVWSYLCYFPELHKILGLNSDALNDI